MNQLTKNKRLLTVLNVIVVTGLILLNYLGLFSSGGDSGFLLVSVGIFVLAMYRPAVVFALLVGVIPIEIINIIPEQFGFALRPYQLLAGILFGAIVLRALFGGKTHLPLRQTGRNASLRRVRWSIFDTLIVIFIALGFGNYFALGMHATSLKPSLIVLSFGILYFVVRFFVRTKEDLLALFPILISSGVVIGLYGIFQNLLFLTGKNSMEVMPGRPNATFAEADWLGVYMVFIIAVALSYLYYNANHKHLWKFFDIALFSSTTVFFVTLIITVARSAWLGALVVIFVYLAILFLQKRYKLMAMHLFWIFAVSLTSFIIVLLFHLTNFELFNRVASTGNGLQEITVSCQCSGQACLSTTSVINDVSELAQYNCRHINLEEIESEKAGGNEVLKIYRRDPNVAVRSDVYSKTVTLIKQNPIIGYGWGSSGKLLGNDENGTPLNASNVFLETVLSIGIIGGVILALIFGFAFVVAIKILRNTKSSRQKTVAIFVVIGSFAIIVPNLFNAGLLLGFVWLFFGTIAVLQKM